MSWPPVLSISLEAEFKAGSIPDEFVPGPRLFSEFCVSLMSVVVSRHHDQDQCRVGTAPLSLHVLMTVGS